MYHKDCERSFSRPPKEKSTRSDNIKEAMDKIYEFLENSDDCQFTINELLDQVGG